MKPMPRSELPLPLDFFPRDTMTVPTMIASTDAYSRRVYFALPRSRDPSITGTILPDFANVTTGNDTPEARASDVKALADI